MTTRSFSPSPDRPDIPHGTAVDPLAPSDGGPADGSPPTSRPSQEGPARTGHEGENSDPMHRLVQAAVADRPLDEVLQLITLLEQSPKYAQATVDALRAVGVDRSVEDVTRLVTLLTRPPRHPDCADEAIRAAAESRPVEDVTRLMALLQQAPLEPHCGEEAVRAAAGRPVEELVQLIGRLAEEQDVSARGSERAADQNTPRSTAPGQDAHDAPDPESTDGHRPAVRQHRPRRVRTATRRAAPPLWPRLIAAAALVLCGLLYFPLHRAGASGTAFGCVLGVSILCVLLAPAVILHGGLSVLAVSMVVPAALAALQLFDGRFHSTRLSDALRITAAPSWFAGLMAVLAALAALTALLALLASRRFGRQLDLPGHPDQPALADANRTPQ
ncbi:hypothetical protein JHN63_01115 [Streptomyces sp. MBT65]|uniref:hypothetical protein n=1 Tax=Streptomyces sp. MBT65 TaxID=1488395 RepID=UPI00190BBCEB|nr:hypothetical protein [Streptomyces sp. MBT65]MBK3572445.1 hypothetical protein [Streptomyces sp. MBT65]